MIFLALTLTSVGILAATAIVSFALGLMIKTGVIGRQRKRILALEDEMLSNHAKILSLEKKLSEVQKEHSQNLQDRKADHGGLRAS